MGYWIKQTLDKPAFPDMLWSRPERRDQAGKLLVVGGNKHSFRVAAEAYTHATTAGIGTTRVVLPDSLRRTLHTIFPEAEYAASNPSGGFATAAAGELAAAAEWGDAVLLAGDVSHNSQTTVALEAFLRVYDGPVVISGDTIDCFQASPGSILERPGTTLVVMLADLQKLLMHARFTSAITQDMDLLRLVPALHDITNRYSTHIIVKTPTHILVGVGGQVSSTPQASAALWPTKTAANAAVWWAQHPEQPFEALTTAIRDN